MLVKHVVSSTAAAGIAAVCGIALAILTSRLLGVSGRGSLALILNAIGLVLPLTGLGLKQSAAYFIGKHDVRELRVLAVQACVAPVAGALTLFGAMLLLIIADDIVLGPTLSAWLSVFILSRIAFDYLSGLLLARARIYVLNSLTVLRSALETASAAGMVIAFQDVEAYFVGIAAGSGVAASTALLTVWRLRPGGEAAGSPARQPFLVDVRMLVAKGVMYAAPMFVMGLNYGVDIVMLGALTNIATVGLYSVAVTTVNAIWFLPGIVNVVVFSHGVATRSTEADAYSRTIFRNAMRVMLILLPVVVAFGFFAERFIRLVFGGEFAPAAPALVLLLPGAYLMVLFKLLNGDLAARGFPGVAFRAFSIALIVNIGANLLLIPAYAHVGAAVASTLSYTAGAAVFLHVYLKITNAHRS